MESRLGAVVQAGFPKAREPQASQLPLLWIP